MTWSSQGSTLGQLWSGVEASCPGCRKEPSSSEADDVSVVETTRTGVVWVQPRGSGAPTWLWTHALRTAGCAQTSRRACI